MTIKHGFHKSDELYLSFFDIIKLLFGRKLKGSGINVRRF